MLQNDVKYFKMFQNVLSCLKWLQIIADVAKCYKMLQNVLYCSKMFQMLETVEKGHWMIKFV